MRFIQRCPLILCFDRNCAALHGLNHLGPEGYHWRVCVEDKPAPGETSTTKSFSWWDIQDENAVLPLKSAPQSQLAKFFAPRKAHADSELETATKAAKGAFKSLGKALAGHETGGEGGPVVSVVALKLLDLVKMHDDFANKNHGRGGVIPQPVRTPPARPSGKMSGLTSSAPAPRPSAQSHHRQQPHQRTPAARPPAAKQAPARKQSSEASLMDFGGSAPSSAGSRTLHHAMSSPAGFGNRGNPNETRAERLKREYAEKKSKANRVWDDVDQRWVEVDPKASISARPTKSAPPGADAVNANKKKEVGISLDPANAAGKSANVQAAVNQRVNEMKESQAKALAEVRAREEKKKADEAEEDMVRKKLEPKIKAWSEEHGKKKQLRALLASLHTILWPGANWKQVSIGDLLDDSKVKRCFHKASRVVHPDKTHHLNAEQRFLAKRIFDALSQAKTEFDNGAK